MERNTKTCFSRFKEILNMERKKEARLHQFLGRASSVVTIDDNSSVRMPFNNLSFDPVKFVKSLR